MASDRFERKEAELKILKSAFERSPELFEEKTFIENNAALMDVGIEIPGKQNFPLGLLKLYPEDFIVEERIDDGIRLITSPESEPLVEKFPTLYATLIKSNISTFEAVADIARTLDTKVENISFAGLKDKQAITAQKISLRHVTPEQVRKLSSPYYFFADWQGGNGIAERGHLDGNQFTILVRTEKSFFDPERFSHFAGHLKRVMNEGFTNFFYLQRFGTARLRNFYWAWLILLGKYDDAMYDYLSYTGERELEYFKQLRRTIADAIPNWDAVYELLEPFPLIFEQELAVVSYLRQHPDDIPGAFNQIPEQITFWMYALSSMLFNRRLSEYLASGEHMPDTLPFFLSRDRKDQDVYRPMLEKMGIYPPRFENLRPFPQVQLRSRQNLTRAQADFQKAELTDEGIVFKFNLGKGQYATTMLSHLFNLVSGIPPVGFMDIKVDTKAILSEPPITGIIERFKDVNKSRGESFLSQFEDI